MKTQQLEIVGILQKDVPEAHAVAGDRVIFRPGHGDRSRECVVMHSVDDPDVFFQAIQTGALDIIGVRPAGLVASARWALLHLLRRPQRRLALVRSLVMTLTWPTAFLSG